MDRSRERSPDRRRALLVAALGFLQVPTRAPELAVLHRWLDSWRGVGHVVDGMLRQGYTVSLRNAGVDHGWIASFHGHPMISAAGFATGEAPWTAVQLAAWTVIRREG
jgi:hypothetical protein